jgi:16S rRNA C967 or C1407 C5-methylase (RsmB/RsmF family)/NOL1/NOP2/fmu family ribosome biogenesis protein
MLKKTENNLPTAFQKRIELQLGQRSVEFLQSLKTAAPVSIRLNPEKHSSAFPSATPVPWCNTGFYLEDRPVFTLDPFFHAGSYYVQEAGSMLTGLLVEHMLRLKNEAITVLDLCAAPGGKSTHLLSLLPEGSCLVSNEPINTRNAVLRENIMRWGYADVIITQNEAADFASNGAKFDLIVVDAPCSGEGLFRKDPEAISEWSEAKAEGCALRQKQILDDLLPALKEEGFLLFSTCTYNPDENDRQIKRLLDQGFFRLELPEAPLNVVHTGYGWQAWPHLVKSEGFYCTLLKKTGSNGNSGMVKEIRNNSNKYPQTLKSDSLKSYLKPDSGLSFYQRSDFVYAWRESVQSLHRQLVKNITIRQAGLLIGEIKGKDMIPSHALAMSIDRNESLSGYSTDYDGAIRYLRGQDPGITDEGQGWAILLYRGTALGWIKKISGRSNNYYPLSIRIRMK